jgi:hypothetical protein
MVKQGYGAECAKTGNYKCFIHTGQAIAYYLSNPSLSSFADLRPWDMLDEQYRHLAPKLSR